MDEKIKALIFWISQHAEQESELLTVNPAWTVNAHDTLHQIAELFEIDEQEMLDLVEK